LDKVTVHGFCFTQRRKVLFHAKTPRRQRSQSFSRILCALCFLCGSAWNPRREIPWNVWTVTG